MSITKLLLRLSIILAIPTVIAGLVYLQIKSYFLEPVNLANTSPIVVEIPADATTPQIATILESESLIKADWVITTLVMLSKTPLKIQAGEYELTPAMTPKEIIKKLSLGELLKRKINISAGQTINEIALEFEKAKLAKKEDILATLKDSELLSRSGITSGSFEGYLAPGEYEFSKFEPLPIMVGKIIEANEKNWTPELLSKATEIKLSKNEILTLASLIQAETSDPNIQIAISGVYHNRLMNLMRLESLPALKYGLKDSKSEPLDADYEDTNNPYNTFANFGLPPGPINTPGKDAINAAVNYQNHQYLFFLRDKSDKIVFAQTLNEYLALKENNPSAQAGQ